jgi:excisionase family DNA binding protein
MTMTDRHPGEIDVGTAVLGLVTVKQVAVLLNYSEKQIRRMIAAGTLEAIKDGGSLRILPESIIAYKERLRVNRDRPVCETCSGTPPEGFICTACGHASRVRRVAS